MTVSFRQYLVFALILILGCNSSDDEVIVNGLKLSTIQIVSDGQVILEEIVSNFEATVEGNQFTYIQGGIRFDGTWSMSEDEEWLDVEFESGVFQFPIMQSDQNSFAFVAYSIDLINELSEEDLRMALFVNQRLVESGQTWEQLSNSAALIEIVFVIEYQ